MIGRTIVLELISGNQLKIASFKITESAQFLLQLAVEIIGLVGFGGGNKSSDGFTRYFVDPVNSRDFFD